MGEQGRNRFIAAATLGYAALATLWIVFSDRMLGGIADAETVTALATLKGIAFVLVTSIALAMVLRRAPLPDGASSAFQEPPRVRPWGPLVVLATVTIAISAIGIIAYRAGSEELKHGEFEELQAVAQVKVATVSRWLDERRANAVALSRDPAIVNALTIWQATNAAAERASVQGAIASMRQTYGFSAVQLIYADGNPILQDGNVTLGGGRLRRAIDEALATGEAAFVDLYRTDSETGVRMAYVAPMGVPRSAQGVARTLVVLEMRPEDYLYPSLRSWPLPDKTGEAALVRRDWGDVVYLNDLRNRPGSALRIRFSLSIKTLPAAKLLLGQESEIEGTDYRGVKVLESGLPVPGTPWFLMAKVDESEAYAGIRRLALLTVALTAAALVTAATLAGFVWQRQRLRAALIDVAMRRETAEAQLRFQSTFDKAGTGIAHVALDGRWLRVNPPLCEMLGYAREKLLATDFQSLTDPEYRDADRLAMEQFFSGTITSQRGERLQRRRDGRTIWIDFTVSLVRGPDGAPDFFVLVVLDITERKRSEEQLRQAAAVFSNTQEGVIIADAEGRIVRVNPAVCAITGYSEVELCGNTFKLLQSGRHDPAFYQNLWRTIRSAGFWQGEIWNRRKNGEIYPELLTISTVRDAKGEVSNYVGTFTDITYLKRSQEQFEHLAHHDPLTGLPNRLLLLSRLDHAIERMKRHDIAGAVLFLDLDRFKNVNDSLGHPAGDELLIAVAGRIRLRLRDSDTLARLGGDEFVAVLEDLSASEQAAGVAQALIDRLSEPFQLAGGHEVYIGASIGISMFPADGQLAQELIQQADTALYAAKEGGRGIYRFYRTELTEAANTRLDLEARLRRGLERGEMVLHYQPLVAVADQRIIGVEALLRWRDPIEGLMMPTRFIPLAEETGLIVPLGDWVLREACRRLQAWREAGVAIDSIAVNLSPRQFQQVEILDQVRNVLTETGLPSHCLELEITESALMHPGAATLEKLAALKALGVRLAVDDFGTGYSSLSYLKRFPLDRLKIDRSFIADIPGNAADMEISGAIIGIAKNLHLEVLAEGVETAAQLEFLKQHGCDSAQGYLFARPLPEADLLRMLADRAAQARPFPLSATGS